MNILFLTNNQKGEMNRKRSQPRFLDTKYIEMNRQLTKNFQPHLWVIIIIIIFFFYR